MLAVGEAGRTLLDLLDGWHEEDGAPAALLATDGRPPASRAELAVQARSIAAMITQAGIRRSETVAVALPNGPEAAVGFLGVAAAAVCAPVNPAATRAEAAFLLADTGATALVTAAAGTSAVRAAAVERGLVCIEVEPGPSAGIVISTGELLSTRRPRPDDIALVLHTSGTTSRPKLVPLTHRNLTESCASVAASLELSPNDRCLNVMPLFHIHGLVAALLASLEAGGSVVCAPGFVGHEFLRWLGDHEPTWYTAVPTIHHAAIASANGARIESSLRLIRSSSAALPPTLLNALERTFDVPVIEAYGMTEAAHQMASNPLPPGVRRPGTVGRAAGPELGVLDEEGRFLPPGVQGEIVVRGPGVMSGYSANPEANAAAFVDGWFRTGDLGMIDADGYLTLTGRRKEMINRGGEKIAPREVDEALLEHPEVDQAVAFGVPHPTLGEDIAAAVVLRAGADTEPEALRTFMGDRLTAHKIPRQILVVDEIPLGPSGKLQRQALAEQLGLTRVAPRAVDAQEAGPTTPTEVALAGIWAQVLGRDSVPVDVDFVALGGDSLRGAQLLSHVASVTGVEVPISALFEEAGTVAGMALFVEKRRERPGVSTAPASGSDIGVLSLAQERLWFLGRLEPGLVAYNVPLLLRLRGRLDVDALERSLELLLQRHDVLRSRVEVDSQGDPWAVSAPRARLALVAEKVDELKAQAEAAAEAALPFSLERAPLYRLRLWRLAPDEHLLLFVQHHFVTDGWSRGILVSELGTAYAALSEGRNPDFRPLPITYYDLAAWQRERLRRGDLDDQLAWWRRALAAPPPPLELPLDNLRPARQSYEGARVEAELGEPVRAGLLALAAPHGATLFMVLLAGFAALMHRLTGRDDLVIGVPVAGRSRPQTEPIVGLFVNTLPVRIDLAGDPSFGELVARVRAACLGAFDNQDVPFERLVEEVNPERDLSRSPLVQVLFQLRNLPKPETTFPPELEVSEEPLDLGMAKFDLTVDVVDRGDRLALTYEYPTALFERATVERLAARLECLLDGAVIGPDRALSALPILPTAERELLLALGDGGPPEEDDLGTILDRFRAHARETPARLAVDDGRRQLTYAGLAAAATELAHGLRADGAAPGTFVAVHVRRSSDAIVALLAVLETGAAYLPLDPASPAARLSAILEDARPSLIVVGGDAQLPECEAKIVRLSNPRPAEDRSPLPQAMPDDPAYVLFTSGSTGRPKGVVGSHRTLVERARFAWSVAAPCDDNVFAQRTSLTFIDHTWEIFGALGQGAALVVVSDEDVRDPQLLVRRLADARVTWLVLVPSLLTVLLEAVPDLAQRVPSLHVLVLSGETFPPDLARRALRALPGVRIVNELGATEYSAELATTTIGAPLHGSVPVGRPCPGTELAVVLADGGAAPVGVIGELAVGGAALPHGYLHHDEAREERLVEHPLRPGVSLWRSGDLARWGADGLLHHVGRADRQLKLRGMRVEPGEIEAAMRSHPDVADVVVAPVEGPDGIALVAHVLPADGARPDPALLQSHAAELVPPHMVPWRVLVTREFPRTTSGKLDRDQVALDRSEARESPRRMSELERGIGDLFRELLRLPGQPARDDDFFELGGHSLLAIRLMVLLEHRLGIRVTLASLIQAPTPAGLAAIATRDLAAESGSRSPLVEAVSADGDVALFIISGVFGMPWIARRLGRLLEPRGPIYGFEAFGHRRGERPLESVQEIARAYAAAVQSVRQGRRIVLVGFCFGGHVAYEIARVLRNAGETVDRLVVVDERPVRTAPNQLPLSQRWRRALRRRFNPTGRGVQRRIERAGRRLRGARPGDDRRRRKVRRAHETAAAAYSTLTLDVGLVLLRAQGDFGSYVGRWDYGWGAFVREVEVVQLETMHDEMTAEGAAITTAALQAIVDNVARS